MTSKLHLHHRSDGLLIDACAQGCVDNPRYRIKIAGAWHQHSLILTPQTVKWWDAADASALRVEHFERLAEMDAEVVLLGAGARAIFPHASLTQALMKKRIGLEVMTTPAACRTYNILAGDGRRAVAALIA